MMNLNIEERETMTQKKYDSKEALEYLRARHPDLDIKVDSFYHRLNRMRAKGQVEKVQVVSRKEKQCRRRGIPYEGAPVYRYYFTQAQLDSMRFRVPRLLINPVRIHDLTELEPLIKRFGKLVDMQGLIEALHEKYQVWYGESTIRNKQRRGGLLCVAITGKNTALYPVKQLEFINFDPDRIAVKDGRKETSVLTLEEQEKIQAWLDNAGTNAVR